jgi:hypoxia up-regulated 1
MLLQYIKMLAEKQAEGYVRDCVITVPSWFTYDQRLMMRDAAEGLANFNVLQLTHENLAAATMYGIDQKVENDEKRIVLIYNMGGMDTEVTIAEFSMVNVTEKKWSPHIKILAESYAKELGSMDLDIIIVNLLAEKFNALPARAGKPDVRENVRAVKRLFKDAVKIKETLSANKFANVKIPELLDYVTLQINLPREEFEERAADYFNQVSKPIDDALEIAGLKIEDINQVEIIGGGVRVPKVTEKIEEHLKRKDLAVHLNGDEAMCFGAAFIASNSSQTMKVKQIFLTQNPDYEVMLKISPINPDDAMSEADQLAEGREENDIIKFNQEIKLFNKTDYLGKSKGLSMNYNKNMKLEFFRVDDANPILLDTFLLDDLQTQYEYEV